MTIRSHFLALACLFAACPVHAVINPALQPSHLAERYEQVLYCRVVTIDKSALSAVIRVEGVGKGKFELREISLKAAGADVADAILTLQKGQEIVAYAGKKRRRRENDVLYYIGRGTWYVGTMADGIGQWRVLGNADRGKDPSSSEIMFGTFNGEAASLWEMMQDTARGTAYFPAVPFTRFSVRTIGNFDKPVHGVGIYDVNSDGRLDLFACSAAGNRLFIQNDRGVFVERQGEFGLGDTRGSSCSFSDVDGDGDTDLLLDGVLYKQDKGRFKKSVDVPRAGDCLSAAFMEYNGDGYPDVLVSRRDAGLALYVNPGKGGGAFEDMTEDAGLADEDSGGQRTGYFELCDWDVDGRTDLIYVAGPGYLLWQNADGVFEPSEIGGLDDDLSEGTAAFGTITGAAEPSVYLVAGDRKMLVRDEGGTLANVVRSGNEIQDPVSGLLMAVAEDLNADATIDLYAASQRKGLSSFFVTNRGYLSFMLPEKYRGGKIVPPDIYNQQVFGLAAGDVNGDGAIDLLVGGRDGRLSVLVNETLRDRPLKPEPSTTTDRRKQIQTRIVTVKLAGGKGVNGSRLTLVADQGQPITHRWIGTNVGLGCSGPAQFTLAIREPGRYTLRLRRGDGSIKEQLLVLDENSPRHQILKID